MALYKDNFNCCKNEIKVNGLCDLNSIYFSNSNSINYKKDYNWTEICIPNILNLENSDFPIKEITSASVNIIVDSYKLIETPVYLKTITTGEFTQYEVDNDGYPIPIPNEEGNYLTGRKLLVDGDINIKIIYEPCNCTCSSLKTLRFKIPFATYIVIYPKFINNNLLIGDAMIDLIESFCVDTCIESATVRPLSHLSLYTNIVLFLRANPRI